MSPDDVAERLRELERDRVAWNLPSPPPEQVRLPPEQNWPALPFAAVKDPERVRPAA
jgi:hypothetical protein